MIYDPNDCSILTDKGDAQSGINGRLNMALRLIDSDDPQVGFISSGDEDEDKSLSERGLDKEVPDDQIWEFILPIGMPSTLIPGSYTISNDDAVITFASDDDTHGTPLCPNSPAALR